MRPLEPKGVDSGFSSNSPFIFNNPGCFYVYNSISIRSGVFLRLGHNVFHEKSQPRFSFLHENLPSTISGNQLSQASRVQVRPEGEPRLDANIFEPSAVHSGASCFRLHPNSQAGTRKQQAIYAVRETELVTIECFE